MADQAKPQKVTVDLDEVWQPAAVGIFRASVFAGLGTNAARDSGLVDFDLPGLVKLSYSRSTPDIKEAKLEFERWVLASAFREAVESFGIALDGSYRVLLLAEWAKTRTRPANSRFRKFHHAGAEGKLEILQAEFDIGTAPAAYFRSLNRARNCLAHRMGLVGPEDCTEEKALVVRYRRMEFVAVEENGREQIIPADSGGTFRVDSPANVVLRFREEECRFTLGTRLLLEPSQVKYIFWTLNQCGLEVKANIIAKLGEMGLPVTSKQSATGQASPGPELRKP